MATVTSTRLLEDGDIENVLDLMRISLGEPRLLRRTPELFRWKHLDNPFGRSIALVAEEDGRIVGLRTFMRWNLITPEGETLRCIRAVDTATHPDYQRMGIFRRLTEEGVEIAKDDGVDMIFNTPNEKSKPGYLKMGWQEVASIGAMSRPAMALLSRPGGDDLDPADYLRSPTPVRVDHLSDRPPAGLRTPRTPDYLAWRFAGHPSARYFAAGGDSGSAIVRPNLRNGRHELVLADVFGSPSAGIKSAVAARKGSYLATWFPPGTEERSAALRHGFFPIPGVAALQLVMRPLRELPAGYSSIESWDVAVSDFELL